ncbi:MAG: hypothetical protein ABIJ97_07095 [Bacteroidota bacterium]
MDNEKIMPLFYEIFVLGTAYVVGGFFRDFLSGKESRDIDIIVDITNSQLAEIIAKSSFSYSVNRQGGIKLKLQNIELDIWSIENNWAFKNNLVKLNEDDKLNSIAKGCFYNYDSLVINLHKFSYNLRYYNDFTKSNKLNILQENSIYKNLNPSVEANILRAFYIKNKFNSSFTDNTSCYLQKKLGHLQDNYSNVVQRLIEIKQKYPKYNELSSERIEKYINDIRSNFYKNNQTQLDL